MFTYTVHQAKTNLSKLIEQAERGEDVVIARGDKPAVKLVPLEPPAKPKRTPGAFKGQIVILDSFYDPMTEEELKLWEGGHPGDPLNLPLEKADEPAA